MIDTLSMLTKQIKDKFEKESYHVDVFQTYFGGFILNASVLGNDGTIHMRYRCRICTEFDCSNGPKPFVSIFGEINDVVLYRGYVSGGKDNTASKRLNDLLQSEDFNKSLNCSIKLPNAIYQSF